MTNKYQSFEGYLKNENDNFNEYLLLEISGIDNY
jgi:hypothetical protein